MELQLLYFYFGLAFAVLLVGLLIVARRYFRVNEGFCAVGTTFGKPVEQRNGQLKIFPPGLHRRAPWTNVKYLSAMEQLIHLNELQAIASDGTTLRVDAKLRMNICQESLHRYAFDLKRAGDHIKNLFTCVLRAEVANFRPQCSTQHESEIAFVGLRQHRNELDGCLQKACFEQFKNSYGITFRSVVVTDIAPPSELESALNAVQNAQAEAATLRLRTQSACEKTIAAAHEGIEISREHAAAAETEIRTLGKILSELRQNNTLQSYLGRRRAEVISNSKLLFYKN